MHPVRVGIVPLAVTGILIGVLSCGGGDPSVRGLSPTAPARDGLVLSGTCLEDCDESFDSCVAAANVQLFTCLGQADGDPLLVDLCYSRHQTALDLCAGVWGACVDACSGAEPDPDPDPDPEPDPFTDPDDRWRKHPQLK